MIIKGLGLALTTEDMKRVTHAVGAMALAMISSAKDGNDIEEAVAMHVVHGKLVAMLEKQKKWKKHPMMMTQTKRTNLPSTMVGGMKYKPFTAGEEPATATSYIIIMFY